ncbi:hypothetical protein FKP32DRAFT_1460071 [Trametes sanguinea]|nr:hypothetical protein FKP32DRAFT_1460071 [Trametes sanguinea]
MDAFIATIDCPVAHDASVSLAKPHLSLFDEPLTVEDVLYAWFDWDKWCADHGSADGIPEHRHDASVASNAFSHVTPLGLDATPGAFKHVDLASPSTSEDNDATTDASNVALFSLRDFDASLPFSDMWLPEESRDLLALSPSSSLTALPAVQQKSQDCKPMTSSHVEVKVEPTETRPCKRKRQVPECDLWSAPPKKARCYAESSSVTVVKRAVSPSPTLPSSSCSSPSSVTSYSSSDGLHPIVVVPPAGLRCPMPGCGISLPAKDSAWRGHFRTEHHDDVCPDVSTGRCSGDCKRACPLPKAGCTAGEKCAASPMSVESIGRHVLNIHMNLRHRCPVCGVEKAQRYSSCQRHINTCIKNTAALAREC